MNKIDDADVDDDDFVPSSVAKKPAKVSPAKKLKTDTIKGVSQKPTDLEDDGDHDGATETPAKGSGRGTGGRGAGSSAGGKGRGFGRGGFMNFGERKDPPHKGEKVIVFFIFIFFFCFWLGSTSLSVKIFLAEPCHIFWCNCVRNSLNLASLCCLISSLQEVPEGAPDCLQGLTFVISGTLDRYVGYICYPNHSE